jgi:hypothetical protein
MSKVLAWNLPHTQMSIYLDSSHEATYVKSTSMELTSHTNEYLFG